MIEGPSQDIRLSAYPLSVGGPADAPILLVPNTTAFGFREGTQYRIEAPVEGFSLRIDDAPLPQLGPGKAESTWLWKPDFYAGQVNAEMVDDEGRIVARFQLDVSPSPNKVGRAVFESMIEDIRAFAPELILGAEPAQTWAGTQGTIQNPFVQYVRLRAHGGAFVAALTKVCEKPLRELRRHRRLVRPQSVKRSDITTVLAAARSSAALALFSQNDTAAPDTDLGESVLFDVPVSRETLDCPANRCLAAALNAVTLRTMALIAYFDQATGAEQDGARTSLSSRWGVRRDWAGSLYRKLRRLQSSEPFRSVRRAGLSAEGLNAISVEPAYARAYRLGWRVLRSGIEGFDETERVWLSPTWEIYERWCFIELARLLEDTYPDLEWNRLTDHKSRAIASIRGTDGEGKTIELLLQPYFPAGDRPSPAGFQSISGARYPDIALTCSTPSGRNCYIFDAKYRTNRPAVLDAMESAHIYRDALRIDDHRVAYAVLLVPAAGGAPWLESPDFIASEKVGVVHLSGDDRAVAAWLKRILE